MGLERWKSRQEKWMNTMNNKSDEEKLKIKIKKLNGSGYSKISQTLFDILFKHYLNNDVYYKGGKYNKEYFLLDSKNKKFYLYDYTDLTNKKIIEFNGDFWHCNPKQYNETHIHPVSKLTSKQIWEYDKNKINFAHTKGFDVLVIWESEYNNNKKLIIKKCIDFLNKK